IVVFQRPIDGEIISQKQKNNKYTLFGYALDRNPITDVGNQTLGAAQNGITSVALYMDTPPAQCTPTISPPCAIGSAGFGGLGVNNTGHAGPGAPVDYGDFSYVTRTYGKQYDNAAWGLSINPSIFAGEQFHTVWAVGRSSITGKTSTAQVTFFIHSAASDSR